MSDTLAVALIKKSARGCCAKALALLIDLFAEIWLCCVNVYHSCWAIESHIKRSGLEIYGVAQKSPRKNLMYLIIAADGHDDGSSAVGVTPPYLSKIYGVSINRGCAKCPWRKRTLGVAQWRKPSAGCNLRHSICSWPMATLLSWPICA